MLTKGKEVKQLAKITKVPNGDSYSYKVTLPKREAEAYIKEYGQDVVLKLWGEGWKLSPKKD